jgi:hypothetical protein
VRYVQADPVTFTAGGLTSGVDLALHMVADRFGQDVAQETANFMEYLGTGWRSNHGIAALDLPVTRQDWNGQIDGKPFMVLHMSTYGASPTFTVDIPSQNVKDVPVTPDQQGKHVSFDIAIPGRAATIAGTIDDADETFTGTFTQTGKSRPLTLRAAGRSKSGP